LNQISTQQTQSITLLKLKEKTLIIAKQAAKAILNSSKAFQEGKKLCSNLNIKLTLMIISEEIEWFKFCVTKIYWPFSFLVSQLTNQVCLPQNLVPFFQDASDRIKMIVFDGDFL
jgi:hypothetical protein